MFESDYKVLVSRTLILIILPWMIASSCSKVRLSSFDYAVNSAIKEKENKILLVGDFRIEEIKYDIKFNKELREYETLLCDITALDNLHANYIFQFTELPSFFLINSQGKICGIYSVQEIMAQCCHSLWDSQISSENLINSNLLYDAYKAVRDTNFVEIHKYLDLLENSSTAGFYSYYLGFKASQLIADNNYEFFLQSAIIDYINNPDPLYSILFAELLDSSESECATILIQEQIDVGPIPQDTTVDYKIPFINIGKEPLIIFHATTSCDCLQVKWDKVTNAGESGEIIVNINTDSNPSDFRRSIFLAANTLDGGVLLNISGQVI